MTLAKADGMLGALNRASRAYMICFADKIIQASISKNGIMEEAPFASSTVTIIQTEP